MIEAVTKRLESFGYIVVDADADDWVLGFIIEKTVNHIKNNCNVLEVPEGLFEVAVDMVVGEFLQWKRASNQLTGFDVDAAIKQIQEGDTSITYGDTPDAKLDFLISYLMNSGANNFATYRTIKW